MSEEQQQPIEEVEEEVPASGEPAQNAEESETPKEEPTSGDDGGEADPEQVEADKALKKGKNYYARKIDQTRREAEDARRMNAELMEVVRRLVPQQQAAPPPVDKPPQRTDFTDYEAYVEAKAEWGATRAAQKQFQEMMSGLTEQVHTHTRAQNNQQAVQQFISKRDAEAKTIPDYQETLEAAADLPIPGHVAQAIAQSDSPARLIHYFAKNQGVVAELSNMQPMQAALRVGQIIAGLKPAHQVSNAPAPGKPVSPSAASSSDPPEDADAYMKWATKRGLK